MRASRHAETHQTARGTGTARCENEDVSDLVERISFRVRHTLPQPVYYYARSRYHTVRKLVGRNPGRGRLLPDFIVIGAAKSGTTSLYGALAEHPFVAPCTTTDPYFLKTKEVHF